MTDQTINRDVTVRGEGARGNNGRLRPGDEILGRYVVEGELGQGGMGVVYRCLDKIGGVEVAVKGLPPEVSHNAEEMEEVRANFSLVSDLRHENICGVRTLECEDCGDFYLVMDLAPGESLARWMKQNASAPFETKLAILRQIAAALDYAHARKIIHRDIKPENVMVAEDGHVSVLDFGLAAQIRSSLSRTSNAVTSKSGTPAYMSPEQWLGQPQGAAADQYALGVIAFRLLAGRLPFDGDDPTVLSLAVTRGKVCFPNEISRSLRSALTRALAKDPGCRFRTCREFVAALAVPGGCWKIASLVFVALGVVATLVIVLWVTTRKLQRLGRQANRGAWEGMQESPLPVPGGDCTVEEHASVREGKGGWTLVTVPREVTFEIPPTMELQQGAYKALKKTAGKALHLDLDLRSAPVVIVPARTSEMDADAFRRYARILFKRVRSNESMDALASFDDDELKQLETLEYLRLKNALQKASETGPEAKLLKWNPVQRTEVGGLKGYRLSLIRRLGSNEPVHVEEYKLFRGHDVYDLTFSYRVSEEAFWKEDFQQVRRTIKFCD